MGDEDRELQIELAELRMDHQHLTSVFMGMLAIEFGAIIGLASIFYGLIGKSVYFLISIAVIVLMFLLVGLVYYTSRRYEKRREELKKRIEELKKKYISTQT